MSKSLLRKLSAAAHVERYAASQARMRCSSFCLRWRQRCAVARRCLALARTCGLSRVRGAVFFLRQRRAGSQAAAQRPHPLRSFLAHAPAVKHQRCRRPCFASRRDARHLRAGATRGLLRVAARHNPSIERTYNGGRSCSAPASSARAVVCRSCRTLAVSSGSNEQYIQRHRQLGARASRRSCRVGAQRAARCGAWCGVRKAWRCSGVWRSKFVHWHHRALAARPTPCSASAVAVKVLRCCAAAGSVRAGLG